MPANRAPAPWGLFGAPSSAAAHWPGIERAPAALRAHDVLARLHAAGVDVQDFGDLPVHAWTAVRSAREPNNVAGVLRALADARARAATVLASGRRPLVLGGECTLTIALVSAFADDRRDVGVVYVDGGQDLLLPAEHPEEPILDGTGVAHLLDLPGAVDALAGIGPRRPLLRAADIVFFGYAEDEEDVHGLVDSVRLPAERVAAQPEGAASRALDALATDEIIVHVDVDVLDFLQLPAADVPVYGRGLRVDVLERALRVLVADPRCRGLLLVEYNPDHDPHGIAAQRLVRLLAAALAPA